MTMNQTIAEIMESCRNDSITIIRSQIEGAIANDEDFVNKVNEGSSSTRSPLHFAARIGRLPLVNLLLELGFDPNRRFQRSAYQCVPLYVSIIHRKYEVAMRLCEVTSDWKYSRIGIWGVPTEISKCKQLIGKMIDNGWNINSLDEYGQHALMNTFNGGHYALIPILINSGANVNVVNYFGDTVLMRAAATGNVQITELLVSSGARVNHQKFDRGEIMTALSFSIRYKRYDIAKYLVENGANIEINLAEDQTLLGLLYDERTFESVVDLLEKTHKDLLDVFDEDDDLYCAHSLEEAEKAVKKMKIDESEKMMILTLCREAKPPKGALELLKFVEIFQIQKNLDGLLNSDKVKEMQIPMNILRMIASPLKWH